MEEHRFLIELLLLLAVAALGVALSERLRLPSIVGFLVMGALVGPAGLALVSDAERVRTLAELGVVFLLFEVGLELPLDRVRRMWRRALVAGGLQVVLTLGIVALACRVLGLDTRASLVMGGLVAMSSTALVMRMLAERGEIDAPHGQITVGILLFQDLCILPLLLGIPLLAGAGTADPLELLLEVGGAVIALVVLFALARSVLPRLFHWAAGLESPDLFTLLAFLVVMGSAVVAQQVGLTLAVGAFIGGLALSASPYSHQLFAEVMPLRGLLLGLFFVAVGMLLDVPRALSQWDGVLFYVGGVVVVKAVIVALVAALALRQGWRLGVLTGVALAQTGEFSFVLAGAAADADLIGPELRQTFVAGSIVTLVATPFLIQAAPRIAELTSRALGRGVDRVVGEEGGLRDHVVVVGFGVAGRNLARVLRSRKSPYVVVDANARSVREASARGEPIVFGDATRRALLEQLDIERARLVLVAITDPLATREVVRAARTIAPEVPIVARARYILEVEPLEKAGASVVIAEEYESALELVAEALRRFGVPEGSITRFSAGLREEGYELLRLPAGAILDPWLGELLEEIATEWVEVPDALRGDVTLGGLDVRARTGSSVLAVERAGATTSNPAPDFRIRPGDRLLVMGTSDQVEKLRALLAGSPADEPDAVL